MTMIAQPFGKLARKITIEVDDQGHQRVTAFDYMVAGGTPENMVMVSLPMKRQTDTRMLVMQLIIVTQLHLQAIFNAMQPGEITRCKDVFHDVVQIGATCPTCGATNAAQANG